MGASGDFESKVSGPPSEGPRHEIPGIRSGPQDRNRPRQGIPRTIGGPIRRVKPTGRFFQIRIMT